MEHVRFERLADDAITTAIFESLQIHVQGVARASYDRRGIAQVTDGFGSVRAVHHRLRSKDKGERAYENKRVCVEWSGGGEGETEAD